MSVADVLLRADKLPFTHLHTLEALAAWVKDSDGYFANRNEPFPPHPTWRLFALMLQAARGYE